MNSRWAALACIAIALTGCGPLKYQLRSSDKAPGADGLLVADIQQDQGRTSLSLGATNLPPPDRIAAGSTSFVAWHRGDDKSPWQRIGALTYDASDRSGALKDASVPEVAFDLEVTVEPSVEPASPSPTIVFAQRVSKK